MLSFSVGRCLYFSGIIRLSVCAPRQGEVISRDSRRMKHIYIIRKGSMTIWKRLDPSAFVKPETDNSEVGQGSLCVLNEILHRSCVTLASDDEDGATGDNRVLFSEIQLIGDTTESIFNSTKLDTDFRLSRLRRLYLDHQQRASSALPPKRVQNDKVTLRTPASLRRAIPRPSASRFRV